MKSKHFLCMLLVFVILLCPLYGMAVGSQTRAEKLDEYRSELGYTVLQKDEYPATCLDFECFSGFSALDYGVSDWKVYALYEGVDEQLLNDYVAYLQDEYGYPINADCDHLPGRYIRMEGGNKAWYMPIRVEIIYDPDSQDLMTAIPMISAITLDAITYLNIPADEL